MKLDEPGWNVTQTGKLHTCTCIQDIMWQSEYSIYVCAYLAYLYTVKYITVDLFSTQDSHFAFLYCCLKCSLQVYSLIRQEITLLKFFIYISYTSNTFFDEQNMFKMFVICTWSFTFLYLFLDPFTVQVTKYVYDYSTAFQMCSSWHILHESFGFHPSKQLHQLFLFNWMHKILAKYLPVLFFCSVPGYYYPSISDRSPRRRGKSRTGHGWDERCASRTLPPQHCWVQTCWISPGCPPGDRNDLARSRTAGVPAPPTAPGCTALLSQILKMGD